MNTREYCLEITEEIRRTIGDIPESQLNCILDDIRKARRIFLLAAGRSKIMLSAFCMRLNHLGFSAYMVGDVTTPPAGKEDLLIVATGSGKTLSVVSIMNKAKELGVQIDLFTTAADSPAYSLSNNRIVMEAPSGLVNGGQELQLMRTLFEQCLFIIAESMTIELSEGMDRTVIASRHANLE